MGIFILITLSFDDIPVLGVVPFVAIFSFIKVSFVDELACMDAPIVDIFSLFFVGKS